MKNSKCKMQNSKLLTIVFTFLFLFSANPVLAICQGPIVPCGRVGTPPCEFCHLFVLLDNIIKFFLTCLVPLVATLMLVTGGFLLLIGGTSPEKVSQAKSLITAAVIGLIIIFVAWVFLNTFMSIIGIAEWTGLREWWKISCP
jgi:amino acid transporter